jgi:hypothetical protein
MHHWFVDEFTGLTYIAFHCSTAYQDKEQCKHTWTLTLLKWRRKRNGHIQ